MAVLAPYQKIAKERSQPDKREGTIFNGENSLLTIKPIGLSAKTNLPSYPTSCLGRWLADLDYLEFCKDIGNPPESAASAESLQKASEAASQ